MSDSGNSSKGFLQVAFDLIKLAVASALGVIIIAVALINFQNISDAAQQLLAKAGRARDIDALGVKMSFNEDGLTDALESYVDKPGEISLEVIKVIRQLGAEEYERLMDVGQLDGLCEYDAPTYKVRGDLALDYKLQDELHLVSITKSPDVLDQVSSYLDQKAAEGQKSQNGRPIYCYDMTLTDLGRNVKTGLVQSFKTAFDGGRERSAPPPVSHEMAQK